MATVIWFESIKPIRIEVSAIEWVDAALPFMEKSVPIISVSAEFSNGIWKKRN